jgi:hypothetical protein
MLRRALLGLGLALALLSPQPVAAAELWDLVTPEEFAARTPPPEARALTALRDDGPRVVIHSPPGFRVGSPVDFDVEFVGRNGSAPDLATLRIEYDMGLFWTDVTTRLLAHARFSGSHLLAPGAKLPVGQHVLRFGISDRAGRRSLALVELTVAAD